MRAISLRIEPPQLAMIKSTGLKPFLRRLRRRVRSFWCVLYNGKHEFYRAHSDTRLYRQCLLCGHETAGWTIDRRDRKLHLVKKEDE